MVQKATPGFREYFAAMYAANLSEAELRQAAYFFQSEEGLAAVSIRLQHEQKIFNAAAKGEQVISETPEYPSVVQKALDTFGSTPAGKYFVGDELAARQPFSSEITDLRNTAMAQCLADPVLREDKKQPRGSMGP